ncbi:MAG: transglutaminase-like domain-containing protein, partial [Clostridiales bacterium]|nr:transglutaminase-like domain-containing protein [Clostridiales bacterium]
MSENINVKTRLKSVIIRYISDPVLIYTAVVMMAIMYHYSKIFTAVYGLAAIVVGALVFRVFDYMMSHKIIGTLYYLMVTSLFILFARGCMELGKSGYQLSFAVWFITPQAAVDYNGLYTLAVFLMFMIFMSSVIYYFTRVRYRIFMGFLIFMIPFAIYGKEAETMPIPFIILMTVVYVVLMVYFRQLKDSDSIVVAEKKETWKSVGIYAVIFASVAAFVPKPEADTDRSVLESLISAERFTDRLVSMLSAFRDTSSGCQYRDVDNNTPLYYALANEELHLKTSTFSTYDYSSDSWHTEEYDTSSAAVYDDTPADIGQTGKLTEAIMLAASLDSDFSEKYGLDEYVTEEITLPDEREVTLYSVYGSTQYAPVPQLAESLIDTNSGKELNLIETGLIRTDGRFDRFVTFTFKYSADTFFADEINKKITDIISVSDYKELLSDAVAVFDANGEYSIFDKYSQLIDDEYWRYRSYDLLLEYGDNERIHDLAMEITSGLESDYDKAKAIEIYFLQNGFVYDLDYVKSRGENAESFLFNTKRGVCFEYATAMVLLARAAGIPARYCEGYLMSEPYESDSFDANFVITPKTAHGFPELYIKGFGWIYFEPTIAPSDDSGKKLTLAQTLMISGVIIISVLLAIFVFIKLYPLISHKLFIMKYRKKDPNNSVFAAM